MACGKPPYVLKDKSDKIHKTKTSQISLRGFVVEMSRNASAVTITPSKPLGSKNRIWHFQNWEIRSLSSDYKCLKTPLRPYPRQMPPRLFRIWYPSGCGRRLLRLLRQFFSWHFVRPFTRSKKSPFPQPHQPPLCGKFCRWRGRIFDVFGDRVCQKQAFV